MTGQERLKLIAAARRRDPFAARDTLETMSSSELGELLDEFEFAQEQIRLERHWRGANRLARVKVTHGRSAA